MSVLQKHYQWAAVCAIYQTLRASGYTALLAGGCVRDALLRKIPKDLDMATDAPPERIEELFPRTVGVGKSFGVIRVLIEGADVEVATFRQDGVYIDGRRPESVVFTTAEQDAQRRDFTVNALFLDPGVEAVLDYVDGQGDIDAQILCAVGDAEKRFAEDHLRILRAIRFSGQLGFEIEDDTFAAIRKMAAKVTDVSAERLFEEMSKVLATEFRSLALRNLKTTGLMKILFPFRANDDSFLNVPTRENWRLWSLFFLPLQKSRLGIAVLKESLEKIRFPNKDKKSITQTYEILTTPKDFFKLSFGERLLRYAEESVRWACQILCYQGTEFQKSIEELHQNWLHLGCRLPEPFLTGHDVPEKYQGRVVGDMLKKAYVLQLEAKIVTREEALAWLKKAGADRSV